MNEHDLDNLAFLMSLKNEAAVRAWFDSQSSDDIVYALSLLYAAQDAVHADQPINDVTQAAELLSQFTL